MNIDTYREFITLARCLNFTQAAEELHMTQPALSKHIAALEREFDAELLIRDRRTVQLSEAGRILFGCALEMVDAYDRAQAAIATVVREKPIRVDGILYDNTVSSIISLSTVLLNDQRHVPIVFEHHENQPLFDLLESDEIDVVFAYLEEHALAERGLVFQPLVQTQFVAVVDRNHPLAERSELHMEDLADETLIQFFDEYSISGWRRIEQVCHAHGFDPKKRPILGRAVTSYATTAPEGGVLILQKDLRQLKFLEDVNQTVSIPIADEDANFIIYYIYKHENEERLRPLLSALEESREIIMSHRRGEE
ncbi:LysR family transcriptional regulator [Arabiibacter massiliensis]|uniref:LysR family transcriptional regulator n=1 Tax=Arabiibacter massiliensis TaxID=1870985 RepID=UPI0009BC159C|nr:LysR family transcriptional regulator [Arabiibacter massiliensis]